MLNRTNYLQVKGTIMNYLILKEASVQRRSRCDLKVYNLASWIVMNLTTWPIGLYRYFDIKVIKFLNKSPRLVQQ